MPQHKGFTLIEVLAALIIISLGMLSVIRAVNQTISNTDYLRQKTLAHWVAMNKLTEVRLSPAAPSTDDTDGDVDMAGTTWHWRMKVSAVQNSTTMQQIVIKVAPKDAGPDASIDSINGVYSNAITVTIGTQPNWDPNFAGGPNASGSSSSSSSKSSGGRP